VQEVKARLQERIAALLRKQEELAAAQGELAAVLAGVGRDVEHTRGQVGQVGSGRGSRRHAGGPGSQHASCAPRPGRPTDAAPWPHRFCQR
jgi:hypothetical protein